MKKVFLFLIVAGFLISCKKTEDTGPKLVFKFKFDSLQTRLNNFGNPVTTLPDGHAAQSPVFHLMSAHYIELAPDSLTQIGTGTILYKANEVTTGGALAIDFSKAVFAGNDEVFFSVPIKNVTPGSYKWLRVSLAYQNYDIRIKYENSTYPVANGMYTGRVASFVGFNTYITSYKVKDQTVTVNANKKQGYGAVEVNDLPLGITRPPVEWQAPERATTVPNPISSTSPIAPGSCVVTGRFLSPSGFTITGTETGDVVITVSLSTNRSFEWKDKNGDGLFQPLNAANTGVEDSVVDMGIRGLIPFVD